MTAPALSDYLNTPYSSKPWQRGGTLIAEDVWTVKEHEEKAATTSGYRPEACGHCICCCLHGLGQRWRVAKDESGCPGYWIRRYLCPLCGAVWQVLPAFLARHLHRTWGGIQSRLVQGGVLQSTGRECRVRVKPSTTRRWAARLLAPAMVLVQALYGSDVVGDSVLAFLGSGASRKELIEALTAVGVLEPPRKLGQLAAWIHRVVPGIRLL